MEEKPLVLVLCTGNSCRSQMAEAILRSVAGDVFQVASAGAAPSGYVHPMAIEVMAELGVDLDPATYYSKHLNEFVARPVETVVTVCGNADKECPTFPGQQYHYCWRFEDPAHATGSEEERLDCFRRVRDQIKMVFEAYGRGRRDQATEMVGADRGESCC
jgi:arsenate reductase